MNHPALVLVCLLLFTTFRVQGQRGKPVHLEESRLLLYAEFNYEANSFNPVLTSEFQFRSGRLLFGEELVDKASIDRKELAGFLEAVNEIGDGMIRTVPVLYAWTTPGGPLESELYLKIKTILLEAVKAHTDASGIYLSLHGSTAVDGMFDPEGDLIASIREAAGPDFVIAASFDMHANQTEKRAKYADIIVGYQTNPHRDHFETGYRTGELLIRTVAGEINPVMKVNKMQLLLGGGINIDFLHPFRKIFKELKKLEKEEEILSVSLFPVHIFIDDPELGYSTVAITDNDEALARRTADRIADLAWEARDVPQPAMFPPEEAIEIARRNWPARKFGTVIFCDVSDAVGAGTPGENTWILNALISKGSDLTTYLTLCDMYAVREAWEKGTGDSVTLKVGGRIDTVFNKAVSYSGKIIFRQETDYGKTMIIRHDGIHLILSELPQNTQGPDDIKFLGLNVMKADIIVVKNLFPFRYKFLLYNRKTLNVQTPGLSNINVMELKYTHIPHPIYPIDEVDDWRIQDE